MEDFEDNIEKEYHERFKDFEELPDDVIWGKIQERITPEPERRPIVFWRNILRPIGIAAGVIFGLLLGGYFISQKKDNLSNTARVKKTVQSIKSKENQFVKDKNKTKEVENKEESLEKERLLTLQTKNQNSFEDDILNNKIQIQKEKGLVISKKEDNENIENDKFLQIEDGKSIVISEVEKQNDLLKTNSLEKEKKEIALKVAENQIVRINEEKINEIDIIAQNNTEINIQIETPKTLLTQTIPFLNSKGTNIQQPTLSISPPELNPVITDYVFEEPRKRLVFIPPTEVFANVTPMLSYYMFSPNKSDNILVNGFNPSSERMSFAAQLGFIYPIAKKLDLRTGLSVITGKSKISYDLTNTGQKVVKIIDDLNIEITPTRSTNIESRNWQYFEIQSDFLYEIKKLQAFSLGFRAGIQTTEIKKPIFNGRIGYRISKPINDKIALWLEPSVSVSLSSHQSVENLFLYRTTGFGLNMGVSLLRGY